MKYISTEEVLERQGDVGNEPLSETDLTIATAVANIIINLPYMDAIGSALMALDSIRYYDLSENAHSAAEVIAWYEAKAKAKEVQHGTR